MRLGNSGHRVIDEGFFSDGDLDFATRGVLGRAVHGASEVGEVLATVARVRHASDWSAQWALTAQAVEKAADDARAGGHLASARSGFLRAATYWSCVVDGLATASDSDGLLDAFRAHRSAWDSFVDCSEGAHVRVAVPYDGGTLPGYLLRPDPSGEPRPTVIVTNGSDGSISDLWVPAAAGALARGWNAFVYDGPGQQSMLFEQQTCFRPDWEAVLGPVVDALVARTDVDAQRLLGYGVSQAGFWLSRALAFEDRLVAAVVDPGVVDVSESWTRPLSKKMVAMLDDDGERHAFDRDMGLATKLPSLGRTLAWRSRPYEHSDWFDLYREVRQYRLDPADAARITTPLLITEPEHEQFWPGQSQRLAELVPHADVVRFSAAEGADRHCQPLGRLVTEDRVFAWFEDRLSGIA
ncbi:hypothetical protein CLV56_2102 [Mumia flava]|uniref:Dipeptidyl aminopeptidase n=1 Tax=Mumia flava TaxID=1348852 RepID=A0A0B2B7T9_9ACTN|nr:dipeptidyl aminopeptidase [Mumia flava]PJJ57863.1 hypothetical protein CLV56_2102 [Mumia flava]